jgi:alpha-tubulin suppressor-like RCC1 family protein
MANVGYQFPILNSDGTFSSTVVDMSSMFVPQSFFLNAGLYAWGSNQFFEIGNSSGVYYSSPIQVGSLTTWKQVSGSGYTAVGVKIDGTLWSWGRNHVGQMGINNTVNYSSPVQVGSLTNWKLVATFCGYSGPSTQFAIQTNGTLWAWGDNSVGQLGIGTIAATQYSSPVQIGALTNWKQVSSGAFYTAATKTDGTLWTWGTNTYGQLGNGTIVYYSSPIQVGSLTNWKQVACGGNFIAAIKTDGTLWTWGINTAGQLGNGTVNIYYSSPIQVGSLTNWQQVSCGYNTYAIRTDGTLWGWGGDGKGQIAAADSTDHSSPIQIGSLNNWKQVSGGLNAFFAIKTNGTLWSCGYGVHGQLGNGTVNINYSSPIQIGNLTIWKTVSSLASTIVAIASPDLPQPA